MFAFQTHLYVKTFRFVLILIAVLEIFLIPLKMVVSESLSTHCLIPLNSFCCFVAAGIEPPTVPEQSIFLRRSKNRH